MTNLSYFKSSLWVTIIGVTLGFFLGWYPSQSVTHGFEIALIVSILAVLEVSLSFDNAVVNASTLENMDDKWRHRFLTWGMIIAVFGMRVIFPLLIVAIAAHLGPFEALSLALSQPQEYARILTGAHHEIAAFGGAFLMMVFLKFFVDEEKDIHWVHVIEEPLTRLGRIEAIQLGITTLVLLGVSSSFQDLAHSMEFLVAGVLGLVTYIVVDGIGAVLDSEGGSGAITSAAKSGLAGFLYLEVLDASFSFDGVLGAFAMTNSLPIIAIGLGIGAMFVRSMTILLVEKGTLTEYRFLESAAFWAIGALACFMLFGVHVEIPEVVTGLTGAIILALGFWTSVRHNHAESVSNQVKQA